MPVYNSENSIFQVVVWDIPFILSGLSLLLRSLPAGPFCDSADRQCKGYSSCSELQIIPRKSAEFIHRVISFNLYWQCFSFFPSISDASPQYLTSQMIYT